MTQSLPMIVPQTAVAETLVALARRHRAAGGLGMQVLSVVGGKAENLLERLPDRVKDGLEQATRSALEAAFDAAQRTRGVLPDSSDRVGRAMTLVTGAVGGMGGIATALAELPVTTTMLLRAIQGIAAEHGFDPEDPETRADCLRVLAAAGPLAEDDGAEIGFFAARVTITGPSLHSLIAAVAPRLAAAMGQKLAAQAVPVIGAVAGAAINYVFTGYYQEMARVQFGLRRLAEDSGRPREELEAELRALLSKK